MRWKEKPPAPEPREGDTRIIYKFLWWPRTIFGETRWLESAGIKQEYRFANREFGKTHALVTIGKLMWRDNEWEKDYPTMRAWHEDHPFERPPDRRIGGENKKPIGARPTPPPAPPQPLRVQT